MATFCPLIKDQCKENECLAWRDEGCVIFSYLDLQVARYRLYDLEDFEEEKPQEVSPELQSISPEKLAQEMIAFAKAEFSMDSEQRIWIHEISEFFWKDRKIDKWELPSNIEIKIEKAERIAEQLLEKEYKEQLEKRLEKEAAELPSLIEDCVNWAKQKGLKKVTHADIDAYLSKNKIDIHYGTKRNLYANANLEMKTTKT